jgi:ribonuclease HI
MAIGVCIQYHRDEPWVLRSGEFLGEGTNNQAELFAVSRGLVFLRRLPDWKSQPVTLYTDSQYTIGVLTKDWFPTKNLDIIESIQWMLQQFPNVTFQHVKGHAGNEGNTIVDRLAGVCRKNRGSWFADEPLTSLTKLP